MMPNLTPLQFARIAAVGVIVLIVASTPARDLPWTGSGKLSEHRFEASSRQGCRPWLEIKRGAYRSQSARLVDSMSNIQYG
jgi:hypothetical protein